MGLALNNLQRWICHKPKQTKRGLFSKMKKYRKFKHSLGARDLTPLKRSSQCILQPQLTGLENL